MSGQFLAPTGPAGSARRCQFIELTRTSCLSPQVVRINADLLHFQFVPPASESSIGGVVELIGARIAAQASVRKAITSKGCFIAVLLIPFVLLAACFPAHHFAWRIVIRRLFPAVFADRENGFIQWGELFHGRLGRRNLFKRSRPKFGTLTGETWIMRSGMGTWARLLARQRRHDHRLLAHRVTWCGAAVCPELRLDREWMAEGLWPCRGAVMLGFRPGKR